MLGAIGGSSCHRSDRQPWVEEVMEAEVVEEVEVVQVVVEAVEEVEVEVVVQSPRCRVFSFEGKMEETEQERGKNRKTLVSPPCW